MKPVWLGIRMGHRWSATTNALRPHAFEQGLAAQQSAQQLMTATAFNAKQKPSDASLTDCTGGVHVHTLTIIACGCADRWSAVMIAVLLMLSRRKGARMFELRAAMSRARLWRDQGRNMEARDLLAPIYGWFTEGFDTVDLKDAKALLSQLNANPAVVTMSALWGCFPRFRHSH
jgi:hypothetical protein